MDIDVRADLTEVRKAFRALGPGVDKAASRALNDTITTVRAQGARAIKKDHRALKIGDIKREMRLGRATAKMLSADTRTTGKPLSLKRFNPTATRAGVKATIGNKRVLMGTDRRRAFIIAKWGGEYFVRRNHTTRRVKRIRGPSLPGVFRANLAEFSAIARARWVTTFNNRLRFEIDKAMTRRAGS